MQDSVFLHRTHCRSFYHKACQRLYDKVPGSIRIPGTAINPGVDTLDFLRPRTRAEQGALIPASSFVEPHGTVDNDKHIPVTHHDPERLRRPAITRSTPQGPHP